MFIEIYLVFGSSNLLLDLFVISISSE